jgi:hypothetical protein
LDDFLDELELGHTGTEESRKPFHMILDKNKDDRLQWLKEVSTTLIEQSRARTNVQRSNLKLYRGVSTSSNDKAKSRDYRGPRLSKIQKFVVNHLHDLTETKVSQMAKIKPVVEVLPVNDEHKDAESAKVTNMIIKHLFRINNLDFITQKMQRLARIAGESYLWIDWDEAAGDLHPSYVAAKDQGLTGKVALEDGSQFDMDQPLKTGDVKYKIEFPWRVFLQRTSDICDSEYVFRVKIVPTETLKKDYPKSAKKINESQDLKTFDIEALRDRILEEHTVVYEFHHKKTKYVPEGFKAVFTEDVTLEEGAHPFSHGELPFVRLTDLDIPDVLNGVSKYETVGPMQNMYNNLSTIIAKNIYLTSHAKWVMPRGAAKIEQLGNDTTVVQYQGAVAPTMAQVRPNAREVYEFRALIKDEMQTIFGNHGVSRGEIPKGITASSALQFLNELETQRASTEITKHGFMIRDIARMTIAIAGDMYDVEDGRMVRIVGENNKFAIRSFDTAHLHKSYDIRFDNSSGIPESTAGKHQRVLDAMQRTPNAFSGERWAELLDLSNTEKMTTLLTEAVRSADAENDDLSAGRYVSPPEEWEDHIVHWESHSKYVQSRHFKEDLPPQQKAAFLDHLFWTEEAMLDKMPQNSNFEATLATLKLFPLRAHSNYRAPRSLEQQAMEAQLGAAQIPGQDPAELKKVADLEKQ